VTVIAGAISRNGRALPDWLRNSLTSNLSRHPGDTPEILSGSGWLLAKVDVGAFQCKGTFTTPDGSSLVIAGEPLLSGRQYGACRNREDEGRILLQDFDARSDAALVASTGAFCGAYYSPKEHRLTLIADKLGVRPIYYVVTPEYAAFTSALRIFEVAELTAGELDVRGTYQTCAFGYPLDTRTCYAGIRTIGAAEIIHVTPESEEHLDYFRWDRLERTDGDENRLIRELASTFDRAVARRLRNDRTALAFLSGGLDSRAIITALSKRDVDVLTVNFAPSGTQDRVFADLAAAAIGTKHHQLDVAASSSDDLYRQEYLGQWLDSIGTSASKPERTRCIWSGDGGSCGFGHIYLDNKCVDSFEQGGAEPGIHDFLSYNRITGASNSAMTPAFRKQSNGWHVEDVRNAINSYDGRRDGRALHLFLMLNDQRRHMAAHFENIDKHRFEFLMPFYDSDFLEVILRAPVRPFLGHALYHKWLKALSPAAVSVPWQTYPDHEPCPVPFHGELRYQFSDYYDRAEARRQARKRGRRALAGFWSRTFPRDLIDRFGYAIAILTCLTGSNSYGHVVRVGETFVSRWQRSHSRSATNVLVSKDKLDA
jgi:asparagine synthase (glutamine-hydrolysing)